MIVEHAYRGRSRVLGGARSTSLSFAPDTLREPTRLVAELRRPLPFREAISALHDVVVSNLRFVPKDRTAWRAWLAEQGDLLDWRGIHSQRTRLDERIRTLQAELQELNQRREARGRTWKDAERRYFNYLYERDREAWIVLDPVISVHPDEVLFECFSEDESSYGRLSVGHEELAREGEVAYGTTNIDYSAPLYEEFQKIRSYKRTRLSVDPQGLGVQQGEEAAYREEKIDLPESWVRGFLQVSAAMGMEATVLDLQPMDVHALLFALRRRREKKGPRSLRFRLRPGQPVSVVVEPWFQELTFPRSPYTGNAETEVRLWGRRRLFILERLLPWARSVRLHLLGTGLPSFWEVDLGGLRFTLGLSGWTANDWSRAGHFDLLAPRGRVDDNTAVRVIDALRRAWVSDADSLSRSLSLDRPTVLSALLGLAQAGRAIPDLGTDRWRARELTREPLPLAALRFADPREELARGLVSGRAVNMRRPTLAADGSLEVAGTVRGEERLYTVSLVLDADQRITDGSCGCSAFAHNRMRKGPCAHILALRIRHGQGGVA